MASISSALRWNRVAQSGYDEISREPGHHTKIIVSSEKSTARLNRVVAEARSARETRESGYRSKALKMYPWVCARCAREFHPENLRELTVHHRDHNHDNNPPDGSNWELLCVYCHDNEHARFVDASHGDTMVTQKQDDATHQPFADLANMLKQKK